MKLENDRQHFWQWDVGCTLLLEEPADRVDFCVSGSDEIYSVLPESGHVMVPDICLRKDGMLEVYTVRLFSDGQETACRHSFRIIPRGKPSDYVYTPEEFLSYSGLSSRMDGMLTAPEGGEPGQVLTKTVDGHIWSYGGGGGAGTTFYPHVSEDGILSWENDLGLPNPAPVNLKGAVGNDGFTPSVSVEAVEDGFQLTIVNRNQTNRVLLPRGAAGGEGSAGATFTPHISPDGILSWTNDMDLTNPEPICIRGMDGAPGPAGPAGSQGPQGAEGPAGQPGADGRTPVKGVDYFTDEEIAAMHSGLLTRDGGTMNGSLDLGGNTLRGIAAPVDGTDAANKAYVDAARLIFRNVTVPPSGFSEDASYPAYPFKADIALSAVTSSMIPDVVFPVLNAAEFAPVAHSYQGGVSIFMADVPEETITIPVIILWRGEEV